MNLRQLCKHKEVTLNELAEKTDISLDYLYKLNTGRRNNPSSEIIQKISQVLDISNDEVINSIRH